MKQFIVYQILLGLIVCTAYVVLGMNVDLKNWTTESLEIFHFITVFSAMIFVIIIPKIAKKLSSGR